MEHVCGAQSPDTTDGIGCQPAGYHDTGHQPSAVDDRSSSGCHQLPSPGSPSSVCTLCGRGCGCQQKQSVDDNNTVASVYQRHMSSSSSQGCCVGGVGSAWNCVGGSVKVEASNSATTSFDTSDCEQCVTPLPSSPSAFLASSSSTLSQPQHQQSESCSSESVPIDARTGNNRLKAVNFSKIND